MARDNVGVMVCPFTGALSVVRADCRGKLYYYSEAGKIAPNLPAGQRYVKEQMKPLADFSINETAQGYPPKVEPLTAKPDTVRSEKPLTGESEPKPVKKKSFLDDILGG